MQPGWIESLPWPGVLADLILGVHFLIVLFLLLGQVLVLFGWWRRWAWVRNGWFRLIHLITIGFVVVQTWLGRLCPLTIWEQQLRAAAGQAVHEQSLIQYWLGRTLFVEWPWWVFIALYTTFGLLVLASWWGYPPRWSPTHRSDQPAP
ncbi:MAG: DUF2784 domain-containing protein [Pseudomonadota bacterium]